MILVASQIAQLLEGHYVFAKFGEGVEGASPTYASLPQGCPDGGEDRVDHEQGSDGKEEGVPGRDAGMAPGEQVKSCNCEECEDGRRSRGGEKEEGNRNQAEESQPDAKEECNDGSEPEHGEEILRHDVDDADGSAGPMEGDHPRGRRNPLAEAG